MTLASRLMVLTVGVVLVASAVPGAVAAVPPCDKLLTLQDVTKAAGPGFKTPPKEAAAHLGPGCFYLKRTQQPDSSTLEEDVWLTFSEPPGGAAAKLAELYNGYKLGGAEMASGLGPGAFSLPNPATKTGTWVFFGKGNLYLQLSYKVGNQSDPKPALALAKLVYGRF